MTDTLQVKFEDYEIKKDHNLTIVPSPYILDFTDPNNPSHNFLNDNELFTDHSGNKYRGSKAFFNNDLINLEIKPFFLTGKSNLFCHFSIPKIYYGNNFFSVGKEGSRLVFSKVEKELSSMGVLTDINTAKLSRIDTFKNISSKENFFTYKPIFESLKMSRGKEKYERDYGTTYVFGNAIQQVCIYDKIYEIISKNKERVKKGLKSIDCSQFPKNVIRVEHRLFKNNTIKDKMGIVTIEDYLKDYDNIKDYYNKFMKENLFVYDVQEIELIFASQLTNEMLFYKNNFSGHWLQRFFQDKGIEYLQKINEDVLRASLREILENRMKLNRVMKSIERSKFNQSMLKNIKGVTIGNLYKELKKKLIA